MANDYDFLYKIVLVGDSGVGKTNLLSRFTHDDFHLDSTPTIGVEFESRMHEIEGKSVKMQIWDTAGQERYRAITSAYYRGAVGVILVYDMTKKETYDNLHKWIEEIKSMVNEDTVIVLVGNKSDLKDQRCVFSDDIKAFTEQNRLHHIETSVLDSSNVTETFELMVKEVYKKQPLQGAGPSDNQIRMAHSELKGRRRQSGCC